MTSSISSTLPGAESANLRACSGEKIEMVGSRPLINSLKNDSSKQTEADELLDLTIAHFQKPLAGSWQFSITGTYYLTAV